MASPAAVLSILVTANTSNATRGIMRVNSSLGATESSANKALGAIKTMAKGAAIGTGIGLGYAIKKAADFEQQMDSLGSVSGATGREMERFRKQAMKAGADTKFSALDAAKAQTELAKGGASVAQISKGGLRSALALAAAGELDLALAAETSANAMNLFGLKGKDAMKVADQLATAANATTADVEDFSMALKMGGSVAKMAGLSFSETVLSLEALAKIGIRNSDAGTSLKTAIIQLLKPTQKQAELADKLNLSFVDQEGHFKSMADISEMLRDKLGGMTDAQRTATLATLAGTDGVRTLSALYDAGPKKLDKWKAGLEKSGTAAKVAAEKQDNLKGKLENLQGSIETVAIAIGSKMLPTLTDAAEKITDIINDPKLTASEKLDKFGKMFSDALAAAGPMVAKAAGQVGVVAVRAFFNAFRESPVWLKVITAAFLISKFVGPFSKAGVASGAAMAEGAATSFGGRMKGRMYGIGKNIAGAMLIAGIADAVTREGIKGFGDRFQQGASTATLGLIPAPNDIQERLGSIAKQIQRWRGSGLLKLSDPNDPDNSLIRQKDLGDFNHRQKAMLDGMAELRNTANRLFGQNTRLIPEAWSSPKRTQKDLRMLVNEFGRMRSGAITDVKGMRSTVDDQLTRIGRSLGFNTEKGKDAVRQNFTEAAHWIRKNMSDGKGLTDKGTAEMARLMKLHTKQGKDGLKGNMDAIITVIARTMRRGGKITDEGTAMIRQAWIKELRLYGLNPRTVLNRPQEGNAQQIMKQRGGAINVGKASGDSVPAMLERGEYVLNREAVRKVGRKALDQINFAAAPRFQAGGMVDPAWDPGTERLAASISGKVGSWAKRYNANMTAGYDPGGRHLSPGHNVTGTATDMVPLMGDWDLLEKGLQVLVNAGLKVLYGSNGIGTPWPNHGRGNHAHIEWGGAGGLPSFAAKLKRIVVGGPDSALKSIVQSGLDKTRRGAQQSLNSAIGSSFMNGTGGVNGAGGEFGKGALKRLWVQANDGLGDPNLMAAIALAESGGNPNAHNPSGASGLWQILGLPFPGDPFDPLTNARMAGAKLSSQGLGAWEAYTNGNYQQFLQKGGLAGPMNRAVNIVGGLNKKGKRFPAKQRSKVLHKFLDRIKDIGLPPELEKNLKLFQQDADIFGDMADRAGQLTVTDDQGNSVQGIVAGLSEGEWLNKQLEALFKLRNALIRAQEIVIEKRERIAKLVAAARERLDKIADQIRAAAKIKHGLEDQLDEAKKHPRRNAELIKDLRAKIHGIDQAQGVRTRERDVLSKRIIPTLTGQQTKLGDSLRDDIRPGIEQVQGLGSPMERLKSLPAVGVLGGDIFAVQMRLRDLAEKPATVTDTTDDFGRADLLAELLREANLRTAVSQAQYEVFKNLPFAGNFGGGGVVPGPPGQAYAAVVHGGEAIGQPGNVSVIVNGDIVNTPRGKDPVELVIGDKRFKHAVQNTRMRPPAPSRGWG